MNNDTFLIENEDIELCQDICKHINVSELRNRAVANVLAAKIVKKYFTEVEVDTSSGIHNSSQILENWDISDVYINGAYVDVRLILEQDDLLVPQKHFDTKLLPVVYMFIELTPELSGATVIGFATPNIVEESNVENGYYRVDREKLLSFYDVESLFYATEEALPDDYEEQIFDFIDNKHSNPIDFLRLLLTSEELRLKLIDVSNVNQIFNYISIDSALKTTIANETNENINNSEISELSLLDESFEVEDLEEVDLTMDNLLEEDTSNPNELDIELNPEDVVLLDDEQKDMDDSIIYLENNDLESFVEESCDDLEENTNMDDMQLEIENDDENITFENYTTTITPALETIENSLSTNYEVNNTQERAQDDILLELTGDSDNKDNQVTITNEQKNPISDGNSQDLLPIIEEVSDKDIVFENNDYKEDNIGDSLNILYNNDSSDETDNSEQEIADFSDYDQSNFNNTVVKKQTLPISMILVGVLIALGIGGFYAINNQKNLNKVETVKLNTAVSNNVKKVKTVKPIAMPNETVENKKTTANRIEGNSLSIPVIENNLDASILVSNLTVNWEVPTSYVSNVAAKRYFTKLGKIIQLNLKTELLLLSKPPITNKMAVELEFNKSTQKFEVKKMVISSGEKVVDDLIMDTVKKVISMNLRNNLSIFSNLQGAPVLVIRL